MSARHVPVARISALVAVAVGAYLIAHGRVAPRWRTLRPGLEMATLHGEPWCKHGSAQIAVLRIDPANFAIRARHYTLTGQGEPLDIVAWQRATHALVVFNAGQFYPDNSYMGLLVCSGKIVSSDLHPGFKAALVARGGPRPDEEDPAPGGRKGDGPGVRKGDGAKDRAPGAHGDARKRSAGVSPGEARVLDLTREPLDAGRPEWAQVAQSFMLFDEAGGVRVRKSDRVANRTVVAEDGRGHLLVITSEGAYTLWDFAKLLKQAPLGLTHAMSMDGGYEAELCVRVDSYRYASFGHWDGNSETDALGSRTVLPAVITVDEK